MRRFAAVFAAVVLLSCGVLQAAICASQCGATPCNYATAGNWTCAAIPTTADTCTITAGETVLIQDDARGCGVTTINGTLAFDENSGSRDADGWRTFTFKAPAPSADTVIFGASGKFVQRKSDRVAWDTTSGIASVNIGPSGQWSAEGYDSPETTVTVVDQGLPSAAQCGQAVGKRFTITPAAYGSMAKQYRRIVFTSGKARNRHFNIASVPGGIPISFDICTDELDEASCTGAAAPYAACTAAGVSKNKQRLTPHATFTGTRTFPASLHSNPIFSGSAAPTVIPATGDKAVLVEDTVMFQSAGTNGYFFYGPFSGGTVDPYFRAVNFDFVSTDAANANPFFGFKASIPGLVAYGPYEFINFHDYSCTDGLYVSGVKNTVFRWNAVHDAGTNAGESAGPIVITGSNGAGACASPPYCTADGAQVTDNVFYRPRGNFMQIGTSAATLVTKNAKINRNMGFDNCTTNTGECNGLECDSCQNSEVAYNALWRLCKGNNFGDFMIDFTGNSPNDGSSIHDNWMVNSCGGGITLDSANLDLGHKVGVTHNYMSHIKGTGGLGGRWYSNIIKNVGLEGTATPSDTVLYNPIRAYGNFLEGVDDTVGASTDCDLAGDSGCARFLMYFAPGPGNNNRDPVKSSDNILIQTDITTANQDAFRVDFVAGQFDNTVEHVTCDQHGTNSLCINFQSNNQAVPTFFTVRDILSTHRGGSVAVSCQIWTNAIYSGGPVWSTLTNTAADNGGIISAACNGTLTRMESPQFQNRTAMDFNYRGNSPELTAGGFPPGSPIGARAFLFNTARINSIWNGLLTFDGDMPINISTPLVPNTDSDGDGVMDLHDNCKFVFNPSQLDSTNSGIGDACR